jgi:hypothetical protein
MRMIDADKYEGVRTPFGIVPTEDILKMLEPIRERDNKIAELDAEVKRLREENERLQKAIRGCDSMKCTWLYKGTYKEMTKHD